MHLITSNENSLNRSHRVDIKYLFYFRATCAIYLTLTFLHDHFFNKEFMKTFVWLTEWGGFCDYLYFWLASIESFSFLLNERKQFFHDQLWVVTQLIFTIAVTLEIPICLMYWGYIFPNEGAEGVSFFLLELNLHAIIIILILVDFYLNDIIILRKHGYILIFIAIAYLVVNLSYVLITGMAVYPGINWKNLISYIIALATLILVFLSFLGVVVYCEKVKQPLRRQLLGVQE